MKIHISTLALFFWGFMMLFAGLSSDFLMICLAMFGLCFALYWHFLHLKSKKDLVEKLESGLNTFFDFKISSNMADNVNNLTLVKEKVRKMMQEE